MFIGDNALWVAIGTSLPGLLRFQIQRQQAVSAPQGQNKSRQDLNVFDLM